jgi:hypothetical protein
MKLRRPRLRLVNNSDVEAFRAAAAANGAYAGPETFPTGTSLDVLELSPAPSAAGETPPPSAALPRLCSVEGGGTPTALKAALAYADELYRDNARLRTALVKALGERDMARAERDQLRASGAGMAP